MFAAPPSELVDPSKQRARRPVTAPPPPVVVTPPPPPPDPVLVELGLEPDVSKLGVEIKRLRGELDTATSGFEREVADAKRLRAESAGLRERLDELRAQIKDRDDQVTAHGRAADELRDELRDLRAEIATQRTSIGELGEQLAAKERQLSRAQDDGAKQKEDLEDRSRQLLELSRTKDEGWKKLNEQLTEIDHLREVINEQERMLEERRVGLIVQEEAIKELRADKEKNLKLMATARNERDEAASAMARAAGQVRTNGSADCSSRIKAARAAQAANRFATSPAISRMLASICDASKPIAIGCKKPINATPPTARSSRIA